MAGFGAAGCALALTASYLVFDRYKSTAVMRITRPLVSDRLLGAIVPPPAIERLSRLESKVLSQGSLLTIMQSPSLDLYASERAHSSAEDAVEKMRKQIEIVPIRRPGKSDIAVFRISFSYPDRDKAQAVVRALVTQFTERNVEFERERWDEAKEGDSVRRILDMKLAGNLEVLDPASLPDTPVGPHRTAVMAGGIGIGLLLGAIVALWRRPQAAALI